MRPHIMVVDDNSDVRDMLKTFLECHAYDVTTAEDGIAALRQIEKITPDLILLDLMIPNMDGPAFIHEIERQGLRSPFAILLLTADCRAKHMGELLRTDGCIGKPFALDDLLRQIETTLEHARPAELSHV